MRPVATDELPASTHGSKRFRMRGNLYLRISTNWAEAFRHCLGPMSGPDLFQELDFRSMAVYMTEDRALILVDHQPMIDANGRAHYKPCLLAAIGDRLVRVGSIAVFSGPVLRGRYAGLLGGQQVVVDQYMHMPNTALRAKVQVVRKATGPAKQEPFAHMTLACLLLQEPGG